MVSPIKQSQIMINRNFYISRGSECIVKKSLDFSDQIENKGWNCPLNKPYEPLGEMCDIYKGFKTLNKTFNKYSLNLNIPIAKPKCIFLKGAMPDFVKEIKNNTIRYATHLKQRPTNSSKIDRDAEITQITKWIKDRRNSRKHSRNDGIEFLTQELESSFIRLKNAQKGKISINPNFSYNQPEFYLTQNSLKTNPYENQLKNESKSKLRIHLKTFTNNFPRKRISIANLEKTAYLNQQQFDTAKIHNSVQKNELQKSLNISTQRDNNIADLSLTNAKPKAQYLKLLTIKQLSEKVKNKLVGGLGISDKGSDKRYEVRELLELINKECEKYTNPTLKIIKQPKNEQISLNLATKIILTCNEFNKTQQKLKEKLVVTLDVQKNNRPKTVSYKKRNFKGPKFAKMNYGEELNKARISAERDKIREYKELAKKYGSAYYKVGRYILENDLENDFEVNSIMDFFKEITEDGQKFNEKHIENILKYLGPQRSNKTSVKKYFF